MSHRWRLYADDQNFEVAIELPKIVATTETEPIDHWFDRGQSVFSGRGAPPRDPHIERDTCSACRYQLMQTRPCDRCCGTGEILRWVSVPHQLVLETAAALRHMIKELEDFDVYYRAAA